MTGDGLDYPPPEAQPAAQPDEAYVKVTVSLPTDTVTMLDAMAKTALMGSRARVIQALIDSVWDSRRDIERIYKTADDFDPKGSADDGLNSLIAISSAAGNIIARLDRFLGIKSE